MQVSRPGYPFSGAISGARDCHAARSLRGLRRPLSPPSAAGSAAFCDYGGSISPIADSAMCNWYRSEEHTSELQSLMRISYAVFCLKKKTVKEHKSTEYRK